MAASSAHSTKEALEFLLAHGAVRYSQEGQVTHLPCSLLPWHPPEGFAQETEAVTALFTQLYHAVAQDDDFLHTELEAARRADDFIERLFRAKAKESAGKPSLYLNRNDCMPSVDGAGKAFPKQVEMNLMASALGEASSVVYRMHKFLGQHSNLKLKENSAGEGLALGLADGYRQVNGDGVILFLIPIGEVSVFDQRILEARLVEKHGLKTLRASLEELGEEGQIRGGDLYFRGHKVTLAYFRTGYGPHHYTNEHAWRARDLIEESTAVSVPSARTQLANTKLIQLVLADVGVLERYLKKEEARRLAATSVAFSKLDAPFVMPSGREALGRDHALEDPDFWVLKPHREGGGNNFFGEDISSRIKTMTREESEAYILMEKIRQPVFSSVRMVNGESIPCQCYTELGFFGTAYYESGSALPLFNRVRGYLLRTKDESMNEGLVLGGYAFLDTYLEL